MKRKRHAHKKSIKRAYLEAGQVCAQILVLLNASGLEFEELAKDFSEVEVNEGDLGEGVGGNNGC